MFVIITISTSGQKYVRTVNGAWTQMIPGFDYGVAKFEGLEALQMVEALRAETDRSVFMEPLN